jgi:hypothetical protein
MTVPFLLVFLCFFYLHSVFNCFLTFSLVILYLSETSNTDLRKLNSNVSVLLLPSALDTTFCYHTVGQALKRCYAILILFIFSCSFPSIF